MSPRALRPPANSVVVFNAVISTGASAPFNRRAAERSQQNLNLISTSPFPLRPLSDLCGNLFPSTIKGTFLPTSTFYIAERHEHPSGGRMTTQRRNPLIKHALTALPLAAALLFASAQLSRAEEVTKTFPVNGHSKVRVLTDDGGVRVSTGDIKQ